MTPLVPARKAEMHVVLHKSRERWACANVTQPDSCSLRCEATVRECDHGHATRSKRAVHIVEEFSGPREVVNARNVRHKIEGAVRIRQLWIYVQVKNTALSRLSV